MKKVCIVTLIIVGFSFSVVLAQIDSQWRGPKRDGFYPNEKLLQEWPTNGPKQLWSVDGLGNGYSSAAVTKDRIYVTGEIRGTGYLFAFDRNGKSIWKSAYGPEWNGSHPGARTTPTVVGDKLYIISARGQAYCFTISGEKIWSVDMMKTFGARNLEWGITESPLVDGDLLFVTPGGRNVMFAAMNRNSGKTRWQVKGNGETSGYCSPVLIQHGNKRIIITMTGKSVVGIDAKTGTYLWSAPHITDYDVNANTPIYFDGNVFIFSGYGTGGQMFRLSENGERIQKVWSNRTLDSQMGSAILYDGYLYGSGHNNRRWHCLDWKSGDVQFSERAIGNKGNIIFSDGMLYCYSERGDVALVKPNPNKLEVISSIRLKQGSGPHWAHMVIKDGRLYVRHGDVLAVFDISRE